MKAVTFHMGIPVVAAAPISPMRPTHIAAISEIPWTIVQCSRVQLCPNWLSCVANKFWCFTTSQSVSQRRVPGSEDLLIWCALCTVRDGLLWVRYFAVSWLAQGNGGKENLCLFCVYSSTGYSGISVPSLFPAVNTNNKISQNSSQLQKCFITCHVFILYNYTW